MLTGAAGKAGIMALLALAAACAERPRDPAGTSERIREGGTILLGQIQGAAPSPEAQAALARAGAQLGARVQATSGDGEELLERLEKGELDLVYGEFAKSSPWAKTVHLGTPFGTREQIGKNERAPRFAFRHGENGWIMRVEQAGR